MDRTAGLRRAYGAQRRDLESSAHGSSRRTAHLDGPITADRRRSGERCPSRPGRAFHRVGRRDHRRGAVARSGPVRLHGRPAIRSADQRRVGGGSDGSGQRSDRLQQHSGIPLCGLGARRWPDVIGRVVRPGRAVAGGPCRARQPALGRWRNGSS